MAKFAVQTSAFAPRINVGALAKTGRSFAQKEDLTPEVLYAVGRYALDHFDGASTIKVGGLQIDIEVKRIDPTDND